MSTIRLKLKRIDPIKYSVIAALLTVVLMIIILGPMMLITSLVGAGAGTEPFGALGAVLGGGFFMIILIPILYGVFVFIITLISTALLNFILKKTGGLDLDFEKSGLDISQIGKPTID